MSRDLPRIAFVRRCHTGKLCFKRKRKARLYADLMMRRYGTKLRAYRCEFCRCFHLTSGAKR